MSHLHARIRPGPFFLHFQCRSAINVTHPSCFALCSLVAPSQTIGYCPPPSIRELTAICALLHLHCDPPPCPPGGAIYTNAVFSLGFIPRVPPAQARCNHFCKSAPGRNWLPGKPYGSPALSKAGEGQEGSISGLAHGHVRGCLCRAGYPRRRVSCFRKMPLHSVEERNDEPATLLVLGWTAPKWHHHGQVA